MAEGDRPSKIPGRGRTDRGMWERGTDLARYLAGVGQVDAAGLCIPTPFSPSVFSFLNAPSGNIHLADFSHLVRGFEHGEENLINFTFNKYRGRTKLWLE